jgi:hypothetical protein
MARWSSSCARGQFPRYPLCQDPVEIARAAIGNRAERVDRDQAQQPVLVPGRQVHGQVAAPRVPDHVGLAGADRVEDRDGIRHVPVDVERPRRSGRFQAALLEPDDGERVIQLGGQRRGVIGQAGAAVKKEHRCPGPGLRRRDHAPRDAGGKHASPSRPGWPDDNPAPDPRNEVNGNPGPDLQRYSRPPLAA